MMKNRGNISFQHALRGLFLLVLSAFGQMAYSQNGNDLVEKGNTKYDEGAFEEAEQLYRDAQTEEGDPFISGFNLGDALFRQERYKEAASVFQTLPKLTDDKKQKAAAFHNLGNAFLKEKKFQESVDAYKESLRNDPKDIDTKYNLSYAKRMLQQQQEQQQQQQDDQQQEDNEEKKDQEQQQDQKEKNQEEKKDQQKQQQDQKEQEENEQQQQQQEQEQQQQEGENQQPQPKGISKEDAERMLEALDQEERKIREKLDKKEERKGVKKTIEKDW